MQPAAVGGCSQLARGEQAAALGKAAEEAYQCHLRAVAALQARPQPLSFVPGACAGHGSNDG